MADKIAVAALARERAGPVGRSAHARAELETLSQR